MIVILEGPDGSGKTTLAKQLSNHYRLAYHHEGVPPIEIPPLEWYGAVLERYRGRDVVLDRLALGERIYGPILRGRDRLGDEGWKVFTKLIAAVGAISVLCLPEYAVCREAWASGRDELFKKEEDFRKSYNAYYHGHRFKHDFVYNYREGAAWIGLKQFLDERRNEPWLPEGVIGSRRARYLFLGDKGSNPDTRVDLPFFATTGSSAYLHRAIEEAGYENHEIAFMNAHRHDTRVMLIPKVNRVIALGTNAAAEAIRQGIQPICVPHPQYWRRFKSKKFGEYVELLRRAM